MQRVHKLGHEIKCPRISARFSVTIVVPTHSGNKVGESGEGCANERVSIGANDLFNHAEMILVFVVNFGFDHIIREKTYFKLGSEWIEETGIFLISRYVQQFRLVRIQFRSSMAENRFCG